MFDEIRNTILYYLQDIGLPIVDGLEKKEDVIPSENINLIFENFVDGNKLQIKAYLEEDFNMYGIKKYLDNINVPSNLISSENNETVYNIVNYTDNIITLNSPIVADFYEGFTKLIVYEEPNEKPNENDDYIQINQNSFFTIKKNNNLTENYARYDVLFYLKNDGNELKSNYYSKKISEIFDSNKLIINEENQKTNKLMYIRERVQSDVFVNNVVDKILRCTMLIKYY